MKRFLTFGLIATMSMTMLAGCGNKTEGVSLKVWVPQNQLDSGIITAQQEAFAAAHPEWDITWTTEVVGEDVAKENILKDVEAAADVFLFSSDQLVELVNAGAIARLGGETEKMVKETIAESVQATAMVGDAVYGIPFTNNTFYMYYDKTLMNEEDIKTIEGIVGIDLPDDQIEKLVDAVKAKIAVDGIGSVLGGLGGLFGRK